MFINCIADDMANNSDLIPLALCNMLSILLNLQFGMRHFLTTERLSNGLWRIPFLCGVFVSLSGFYLKHNVKDHERHASHTFDDLMKDAIITGEGKQQRQPTPLELALSNLRQRLQCSFGVVASTWSSSGW